MTATIVKFEEKRPIDFTTSLEDFKQRKVFCITGSSLETVKRPLSNSRNLSVKSVKGWLTYDAALKRQNEAIRDLTPGGNDNDTETVTPLIGIKFMLENGVIGIDVDVDPGGIKKRSTDVIPDAILDLLKGLPTLVFWSRSGNGLHILLRYTEEVCNYLSKTKVCSHETSIDKGDPFTGDVRIHNGFLACTFKEHPLSSGEMNVADIDTLKRFMPSLFEKYSNSDTENTETLVKSTSIELTEIKERDSVIEFRFNSSLAEAAKTTVREFKNTLQKLPPTYTEHAKRLLEHRGFNDPPDVESSRYWRLVMFGCAYLYVAAKTHNKDELADAVKTGLFEWSARDQSGMYKGPDDVDKRFRYACEQTEKKLRGVESENITKYSTLVLIAKLLHDYPDVKNGLVVPGSMKNIQFMLLKNNLQVMFDPILGLYCLKGDEKFLNDKLKLINDNEYKIFRAKNYSKMFSEKEFRLQMVEFLQEEYDQSSLTTETLSNPLSRILANATHQNLFLQCVESKPWDGVRRLDKFVNLVTFETDDPEKAKFWGRALKKFLIALLAFHRPLRTFIDANGKKQTVNDEPTIPFAYILSGEQATNKSYFTRHILPAGLEKLVREYEGEDYEKETNQKDKRSFLTTRILSIFSECNVMFKNSFNVLKGMVDQHIVTQRRIYKNEKDLLACCGMMGTTNVRGLFVGDNGSRKVVIAIVKYCDSFAADDPFFDRQQIFAEIDYMISVYRRVFPHRKIKNLYSLTKKEIDFNERLNAERSNEFEPRRPDRSDLVYKFMRDCFENFVPPRNKEQRRQYLKECYVKNGGICADSDDFAKTFVKTPQIDQKKLHARAIDKSKPPLIWTKNTLKKYLEYRLFKIGEEYDISFSLNDVNKALQKASSIFTQTKGKSLVPFGNKKAYILDGKLFHGKSKGNRMFLPHALPFEEEKEEKEDEKLIDLS